MCLLFSVLLSLLLPHLVQAVPACQDTIRYCKNCHYNPDSDCKTEVPVVGTSVSQQEAACLRRLQGNSSLYAVVYDPLQMGKCFKYNCEHSENTTYAAGYVTYMRTCNTGIQRLWLCHSITRCS